MICRLKRTRRDRPEEAMEEPAPPTREGAAAARNLLLLLLLLDGSSYLSSFPPLDPVTPNTQNDLKF